MIGANPERGDIIWVQFDQPPHGHEQGGHRPALVISNYEYNSKTGLCIVCPITTRIEKSWPWYIRLDGTQAVIADHVKSIDFAARSARFKAKAPPEVVERVVTYFNTIIKPMK